MLKSASRLFLFLSLLILLSDLAFVALNRQASKASFQESLRRESDTIQRSYNLTLSLVYENMHQLVTLIGHDEQVQQLFLRASRAVGAEGGGKGGSDSVRIRQQLYQRVAPSWKRMMDEFDARQLHFHLGPGDLSFLRVHRPEKFGDRMDELRHIIVDTYADQQPKTGFETGRIYSGLRATLPVFAFDESVNEKTLAGVLEVGTSFKTILDKFKTRAGVEGMVLLRDSHVQETMWPDFIRSELKRPAPGSNFYVEASSSPLVEDLIQEYDQLKHAGDNLATYRIQKQGKEYAIIKIPLYDYQAMKLATEQRSSVGEILVLSDISADVALMESQHKTNILYAVAGFLLVEVLLYGGLRMACGKLKRVIDAQTEEISSLKDHFQQQAMYDDLTGLYNRRALLERLEQEKRLSLRQQIPLALLMLDLDHFKTINDDFGHSIGDEVLKLTAGVLSGAVRTSDSIGRYGGEEFCVILPDTDFSGAMELAERICAGVRSISVEVEPGQTAKVTVSIGVAEAGPQQSTSELINAADAALYLAKRAGRNQVRGTASSHLSRMDVPA